MLVACPSAKKLPPTAFFSAVTRCQMLLRWCDKQEAGLIMLSIFVFFLRTRCSDGCRFATSVSAA